MFDQQHLAWIFTFLDLRSQSDDVREEGRPIEHLMKSFYDDHEGVKDEDDFAETVEH